MTLLMPHTSIPPISSLSRARAFLAEPQRPAPAAMTMLAAAAILAASALILACSVILGPFWQTKEAPSVAAARIFDR
jgi:hypothetical protein